MPKTFTTALADRDALIVEAIAEARHLSVDLLISDVLHEWVADQLKLCKAIAQMRSAKPERPKREKDYELAIAGELVSRGLTVLRQVRTKKGTADLVIANAVVVEVKLDLRSWRDVHQAQGQADAYAAALDLKHAIVCAPGIPEEFRSASVCDVSEAAGVIAALCHVIHPA